MKKLCLMCLMSLSLNLHAMQIDTFEKLRKGTDAEKYVLWTYIDGMKEGALAMFLMNEGNAKYICVPMSDLVNIHDDMNAYKLIEGQSKISKTKEIETLFIQALRRKYPCD